MQYLRVSRLLLHHPSYRLGRNRSQVPEAPVLDTRPLVCQEDFLLWKHQLNTAQPPQSGEADQALRWKREPLPIRLDYHAHAQESLSAYLLKGCFCHSPLLAAYSAQTLHSHHSREPVQRVQCRTLPGTRLHEQTNQKLHEH